MVSEHSEAPAPQELISTSTNQRGAISSHTEAVMSKPAADDPFFVHPSEVNPGLPIVSILLTRTNYLSWSQAMNIALGAKLKLGFINGKCSKPNETEDPIRSELWNRVDCLVRSWIINAMSKDLVDSFLFAPTAKVLWDCIQQRYGQKNGPLLYQLQREINTISQGNSSIESYFTRLMKLQDELISCSPIPICCPDGRKLTEDRQSSTIAMQLLMGLNDSYDHVRNQILVMDPLPNADKIYSMLLSVERQREIQVTYPDKIDSSIMFSKQYDQMESSIAFSKGQDLLKMMNKGKWVKRGADKCSYCHMDGHLMENCFKLKGYPEKKRIDKCSYCHLDGHLKEQCYKLIGYPNRGGREIRSSRVNSVNVADTPLASSHGRVTEAFAGSRHEKPADTAALMQELIHLFKQQNSGHSAGSTKGSRESCKSTKQAY